MKFHYFSEFRAIQLNYFANRQAVLVSIYLSEGQDSAYFEFYFKNYCYYVFVHGFLG